MVTVSNLELQQRQLKGYANILNIAKKKLASTEYTAKYAPRLRGSNPREVALANLPRLRSAVAGAQAKYDTEKAKVQTAVDKWRTQQQEISRQEITRKAEAKKQIAEDKQRAAKSFDERISKESQKGYGMSLPEARAMMKTPPKGSKSEVSKQMGKAKKVIALAKEWKQAKSQRERGRALYLLSGGTWQEWQQKINLLSILTARRNYLLIHSVNLSALHCSIIATR